MATYTDNYQLTKPTYAEQADIGVINSNMNIIDDIMHSSQISLAPAYDSTKTYAEGDVVMYELLMYKCISPTTGVWDGSKWERTTASESGGGGSAELDILGEASGAVASFADGASAGLAKCIAEIVPTQAGSGTPSPDNVRAISGYTSVNVDVRGIQQWDEDWEVGAIGASSGLSSTFSNRIRSKYFNPCEANTDYYVSIGFNVILRIFWYKSNQDYIGYNQINASSGAVITSPSEARFFKISTEGTTYGETYRNDISVNYPSSVTSYIAYAGSTTTTPLGQTVYGGQLNVLTGELTIDRATVDLGSFNWVSESATVSGLARVGVEETRPLGAVYNQTPICSNYEGVAPKGYSAFNNGEIGFSNNETNPMIRVRDQNFASMTDVQIKSAMNGVQMCYYLATPQTVQLTPQEVRSILGQNYIEADTGDIDIVYVKASAPIQPNPTGTPTATLSKLGIEGTVFEVPSGGGGSSLINYSTTEQNTGQKWIDGKDIYQITFTGIVSTPNRIDSIFYYGNIDLSTLNLNIEHGFFDLQHSLYELSGSYINFIYGRVDGTSTLEVWTHYNRTNVPYEITLQYTKITD